MTCVVSILLRLAAQFRTPLYFLTLVFCYE